MAYGHSFNPAFYGSPDHAEQTDRPTSVCDALRSMPDEVWDEMCREVFGCDPDYVDLDTALGKVIDTDTVSNLTVPVRVWIDLEGYYTVDVYDDKEESDQ